MSTSRSPFEGLGKKYNHNGSPQSAAAQTHSSPPPPRLPLYGYTNALHLIGSVIKCYIHVHNPCVLLRCLFLAHYCLSYFVSPAWDFYWAGVFLSSSLSSIVPRTILFKTVLNDLILPVALIVFHILVSFMPIYSTTGTYSVSEYIEPIHV